MWRVLINKDAEEELTCLAFNNAPSCNNWDSFAALHRIWHSMTYRLVSLGKPVAHHCQHTVAVVSAGVKALGTACNSSVQ